MAACWPGADVAARAGDTGKATAELSHGADPARLCWSVAAVKQLCEEISEHQVTALPAHGGHWERESSVGFL